MHEHPEITSKRPEYLRGSREPAFVYQGKKLFINDHLGAFMDHPLATWASPDSAEIDGRAFDILFRACGGETTSFDRERFESYLRAITEFEIAHSDDPERHHHRTPLEKEILRIVTDGGYFADRKDGPKG